VGRDSGAAGQQAQHRWTRRRPDGGHRRSSDTARTGTAPAVGVARARCELALVIPCHAAAASP
jgi:O6-methylguanine-DNA--protein-cysteine methyltransferase